MTEISKHLIDNSDENPGGEIVLSIETGILGGSISLRRRDSEIDFWTGSGQVSKSEDVLDEIEKILSKNDIQKTSIKLAAFSGGPGSFTGIRIGAAIVRGLCRALACRPAAESVLEAMLLAAEENKRTIAAVPFGRRQICWQLFKTNGTGIIQNASMPRASDNDKFAGELANLDFGKLILHESIYEKFIEEEDRAGILQNIPNCGQVINCGANLAGFIARKAQMREAARIEKTGRREEWEEQKKSETTEKQERDENDIRLFYVRNSRE